MIRVFFYSALAAAGSSLTGEAAFSGSLGSSFLESPDSVFSVLLFSNRGIFSFWYCSNCSLNLFASCYSIVGLEIV